jgi:glutathione peroxidase
MANVHEFTMKTIDGAEKSLGDYAGQVLLVVNVASACGLTPQYAGIEALHRKLSARGFSVLGFPANDFGAQEPGTEAQIKEFCQSRYDVSFPMFAKITVKGASKHPLYAYLTTEAAPAGEVAWNFGKFLVGKDGKVIRRFEPTVAPDAPELLSAIEAALD